MATIIRPNQEFTTKATVSKGDTQLVSWIIFNGHNSDAVNIFQIQPKIGLELDYSFSQEGKYRIAAYQKEIQTKDDYQSSTELKHVDVTVSYNALDGSKLQPKNPENFLAGDSLRKGFPAVFEVKFLIKPPTADELSRLQFRLEDAAGNKLNEGSAVANVFTFTPNNSKAKYKLTAEYTNEAGVVSKQTFSGTSKALSIKDITHGAQMVRPGTTISFSVTKTQFQFPVGNGTSLPESGEIKWNLNKVLIGTGQTITIPGNILLQQKKYHIEAYVTSALGKTAGDNNDSAHNDWHFEVKENIVEKIKTIKKPKAGLIGDFEIEEMTFKDYDAAKDGAISWKLTGPETGGGSEKKFSKLFKIAGEYTLSCTMGGRACKEPLKISIVAPIINIDKCKWIDKDNGSGNIITKAGQNQEICAYVNGDGLDNENLTINVYDDDTFSKTIVYTFTFDSNDTHKTGFYHPFTITEEVITKIKKNGTADYGDLYFNIVRNNVDLQIKNGDQKLGEFLKVTLDPKIINAYFCDANDTQQILICALNGALYFKIYAINMVDKKVEISFITESDTYSSWNKNLQIEDWKGIKNKFKKEPARDTKTATFDKKGEIIVPVDLSKMGKPKNFIRLNAMVKIIDETNEEEAQGFYMIYKDLTLLYPPATLPNLAENKGAVMVGREQISGGSENSESDCPRCGTLIIEELNKVFPSASEGKKKAIMNAFNKANIKFGLNQCQQKAHFFAQVMQEVGPSILVKNGESLNYAAEDLPKHFARFRANPGLRKQSPPNDLAYQYGRSSRNGYKANEEMIANITYAGKEDNGDAASGDGWKYRGRGLIQITFKRKYTNVNRRIRDDYPEFGIAIDAENINNLNEGTVASMAYWEEYGCQDIATKGYERKQLDLIVDIVNKDTQSRNDRWNNLKKTIDIFRVNECIKDEVKSQKSVEGANEYYIFKSGKIQHIEGKEKKHTYYVESNANLFKLLYTLEENSSGMVKIPDSGKGFGRYSVIDAGGVSGGETVGKGDRYLLPKTSAALFGIINEINEEDWEIHLGDMSSENGSDPWETGNYHHSGHGHNGTRKGQDIDFRYLNKSGKSFQGFNSSSDFDKNKNKKVYNLAYKYGFRKNYCTNANNIFGESIEGVSNVRDHSNHGHLGLSNINLEVVTSVNVTKL